jgi:DME family drug/metabolite transporter
MDIAVWLSDNIPVLRTGSLAVIGAAVLWGTAGAAGVLAFGSSSAAVAPVALAAARLVIGGFILAMVAVPAARSALVAHRGVLPLTAAAVAGYQLAYFAAVSRTGVAIGTVVAIGSGPVFTGLLSWLLDGHRPTRRWSVATAAAVAGCAALIAGGGAETGRETLAGVLLALLGGLLYACYAVVAARAIGAGSSSNGVMAVLFGGAALIMIPVLLVSGTGWLATPGGLAAALYLGCASTALAYLLYGRGLRTTPVTTAATLALAEPAVAALLGVVLLEERLSPTSLAGLLLVGAGLATVAWPARRPRVAVPRHDIGSVTVGPGSADRGQSSV